MNKPSYCPHCNIGLNTREIESGHCQNCKGSWESDYETNPLCPECLEPTPEDELDLFNGHCEDCSLDFE